jgi:uncharacterized SAM-binding protein YcdF (DUF218 family)
VLAALIYRTGTIDEARPSNVIIVLGAALTDDGQPNKALRRRSEHAALLWQAGYAGSIICTGGVGRNLTRSEADGCRDVLTRAGVPDRAIVLENTSHSTEENARNAQSIMRAHGWRTAILVSDSYHVFRARYIFSRLGIDVVLSPVPLARIDGHAFYVYSVVRELMALQRQVLK